MGEISEKVVEKNKNNIYSETLTNSAELGIINQRDFFDKDISSEKNLNGYYVVRPDDFVYNPRISNLALVGPIKRNKLGRTGVMSPLYYVFRTYNIDKTYLEKYFSSNHWHIFMKLNGDSGARSDRFAIKDSIFREMPISNPSIEEQTKIGNFFEQLENTIALHQEKLNNLKLMKKAFLQVLFPQMGETEPRVRFANFDSKWEQRKLDTLMDFSNGINAPKENYGKGRKMISVMDILSSDELCYENIRNSVEVQSNVEERNKVENGDIVFVRSSEISEEVGWAKAYTDCNYALYSGFSIRGKKKSEYNPIFVEQSLNSNGRKQIEQKAGGSTRFNVSQSILSSINIMIPDFDEQEKIGTLFKQIDNTIVLHKKQVMILIQLKKAYLQKMFI